MFRQMKCLYSHNIQFMEVNMGLIVLFLIIVALSFVTLFRAIKARHLLGIAFSTATILVFGWFSVMTILNSGYPT